MEEHDDHHHHLHIHDPHEPHDHHTPHVHHDSPHSTGPHDHAAGAGVVHRHGPFGRPHSHAPADGAPVSSRSLIWLGISGGLLPCPSALVVLLSAIALHRVAFGMLLIVAFSVGLATVLTAIGLLMVHARGLLERLPASGSLTRMLPVLSAGFVSALGVLIAWQSLVSGGIGLPL